MFPLIVAVVIGAAAVASRALSKADDANDALDQTKEMLAQRDMELAQEKRPSGTSPPGVPSWTRT